MLPTILKSGSSDNYLIEWLSAVAIFAGIAMRPVVALAFGNGLAGPDRACGRADCVDRSGTASGRRAHLEH